MFKVFIEGDEFKEIEFSRHSSFEDAVALALHLHRLTDVKHVVKVFDEDYNVLIFFKRDEDV